MDQVTKPRGRHAVFVDPTGRRHRLARGIGIALGCVMTAYLAFVVFGLVTGSGAPFTPWPAVKPAHRDAAPRNGAPQVKPRPYRPASPRPTGSASAHGAAPTTVRSAPPTTQPTTTQPATTASPTHPGRGRGNGLTKSPNPRKH